MKFSRPFLWPSSLIRLFCAAVCLFPSVLLAHPGHYHPDETDEFDFLRAMFFHSHGSLDYLMGAVVVISVATACLSGRPAVRVSALATALGALAMLPIF